MRRPWNIIDSPVYSLATCSGERVNMNICTYVSAVSMSPKQYMVAVYHNTKTIDLLAESGKAVLQLLHSSQANLVKVLGQKSGKVFDKHNYLLKNNLLGSWKTFPVLKDSCAFIMLDKIERFDTGGDHDIFIFSAVGYKTVSENGVLTFQQLIEKGIIL